MRSKLLQTLFGNAVRMMRANTVSTYTLPPPPQLISTLSPTYASLTPFVRGAQAPLVVRAAILSQARCLHLTPALCKRGKRGKKKGKDDCSGRNLKRRRTGFNKPCPPPPCKCPPKDRHPDTPCPDGFGETRGRRKSDH